MYGIPQIISFKWYTMCGPRVYWPTAFLQNFPAGVKGLNEQPNCIMKRSSSNPQFICTVHMYRTSLSTYLILTKAELPAENFPLHTWWENIVTYYMASLASGQDEPNCALWLSTRAGKMEPSCPLGTTRCIPQTKFHQKPYDKSFTDQVCSFLRVYGPRLRLGL